MHFNSRSMDGLAKVVCYLNPLSSDVYEKLLTAEFDSHASLGAKNSALGIAEAFTIDPGTGRLDKHHLSQFKSITSLSDEVLAEVHIAFMALLDEMSRTIIKPKVLHKALADAGLDSDKVVVLVELWKVRAPEIIDLLKSKSFYSSGTQLDDVQWRLHLLSDQSCNAQPKQPMSEVIFKLRDSQQQPTPLSLNFTHSDLLAFYNNLESIQCKIDQLHR